MPSKRKSYKEESGKATELKRGQKEGSALSAFACLGNALAIVLAELSRLENNLTLETLKADDYLELLEAALKDSINVVPCGSYYSYLHEFKVTFRSTFSMLKNVNCAHSKLLEKHSATTSEGGHFVNNHYETRGHFHNHALHNESAFNQFGVSTIEEQYHSCSDTLDVYDDQVENSNCTGSSSIMESMQVHRRKSDVEKLRENNHNSSDMFDFPRLSESKISDSVTKVKNLLNQCKASDRMCPGESRVKDLRLVRCTVGESPGFVHCKDETFCKVRTENLHEQRNSSTFSPSEDTPLIADFVGDEAESSLTSEKYIAVEDPRLLTNMQGDHMDLSCQSLREETSSFTSRNEFDGIKKAMELVRRPMSHGVKFNESAILAGCSDTVWRQAFLDTFARSVEVQDHHNNIRSLELAHLFKRLKIEEVQIHLTSESNYLMRQNLALKRSNMKFKLWKVFDKKMETAYLELSRKCVDELIAGLSVMLIAQLYGAWKFSYSSLTEVVQYCQQSEPKIKESRWSAFQLNWYSGLLASLSRHFQALTCHVTVVGRMVVSVALIALVSSSLLRHTVTSSSQVMPVTVLLVVLGGICGFAGKLSIQSLGGSGVYWLLLWETLCAFHLFATCFTPTLYYLLNGAHADGGKSRSCQWVAPWIRQFFFHLTLVMLLPLMIGLVPFVTFREMVQRLVFTCFDKLTTLSQSFFIT